MATADDAEATERMRVIRQDVASGLGQRTPVERPSEASLRDAVVEVGASGGSTCYFPLPNIGDTNE